jgi:pimeloyl-ACP methyl ester carboxylesterase
MIVAQLAVALAAAVGWTDITVQPARTDRSLPPFLMSLDRPTERTVETLRRYDVERRYRRDVDGAIETLEKTARTTADPDVVYAVAELSWIEGRRLDRWRKAAALDRYYDAVIFSYYFLFEPGLENGRQPADPRFRQACELYNGSLHRLIRAAQANGQIMPDLLIPLKVHGKELKLRVALASGPPNSPKKSPWTAADVDRVILASDFEVGGLENRSYQFGLGVPLVAIHKPEHPGQEAERFYPPEMAFPLTAFLAANAPLRAPVADASEPGECTLELVDPVSLTKVTVPPVEMPVEADFTTPLAHMWSQTDLNRYRWNGLFRPGQAMGRANLMLLRPYERGKIPVVMVHGLISSPLAWIPMINELLRDPVIQERYQFFLYMYPTGVPIPIAAAGLRETLAQARQYYDPGGSDPGFQQTVLLGHSMGGLLSHMMAVNSEDKFWKLYSPLRFQDILGDARDLAELQSYLFYQPLPFVSRVVFLATPHRGSDLSRRVIGRVGSGLISDPDQINDLIAKLHKKNPDAFAHQFRRLPSSIETLDTDHPMLLALLAMKPAEGVAFHSVIGYTRPGPAASTTDDVVPYRSSHLEGVEEVLVPSDHGVQKAPLAIREVHRILYVHLGIATPNAPAVPSAREAARPGLLHGRR